jgi:hypothetical protein
MLELQK